MNEEFKVDLNINLPEQILALTEINFRLKLMVDLNIEILAALTKKDRNDIAAEYTAKWRQYFIDKFGDMAKT